MAMSTPAAPESPEFLSLALTRKNLRASIAAREAVEHTGPDFRAVTANERARVAEIEARMGEINPEAFAELQKDESAFAR